MSKSKRGVSASAEEPLYPSEKVVKLSSYQDILFSDPVIIAGQGEPSSTGDGDDHVAILAFAMSRGKGGLVVICDSKGAPNRFSDFMARYGNKIREQTGCEFMSEEQFTREVDSEFVIGSDASLVYHSPVKEETTEVIRKHKDVVRHVFTQGSNPKDVNFSSGNFFPLLEELRVNGTKVFCSESMSTRVQCKFDFELLGTLSGTAKDMYSLLKTLQSYKFMGLAIGNEFAGKFANQLYSDTGSSWVAFKDIVQTLRKTGDIEPREAMKDDKTYQEIKKAYNEGLAVHRQLTYDENVIANLRDMFEVLNLYANYEEVRDKGVPTMATLKSHLIVKKPDCPSIVVALLEGQTNLLYDFVSILRYLKILPEDQVAPTPEVLGSLLKEFLTKFSNMEAGVAVQANAGAAVQGSFAGSDGTRGITGVKRDGGKRFTRKLKPMKRKRTNKKRNRTNKKRNTNKRINRRKTLR